MILLPTIHGSLKFHIGSLLLFTAQLDIKNCSPRRRFINILEIPFWMELFLWLDLFNPLWFFLQNPILGWEI